MVDDWAKVLDAIVDGPRAWSTAADIIEFADISHDNVTECLCELVDQGLVAEWPEHGWTLTPLAAELRGVCLHENETFGRLHWGRPGKPQRPPSREQKALTETHAQAIADIPDLHPDPADLAQAREEAERAVKRWKPGRPFDVDNLPWPSVFLTGSQSTWTERPGEKANRKRRGPHKPWKCSACRGKKLKLSYVCGRCFRWGFDALVHAKRREAAMLAREAG